MKKNKKTKQNKGRLSKKDDERYQNLPEEEKDKRHTDASD